MSRGSPSHPALGGGDRSRWVWLVAYAVVTLLSFPHWVAGSVIDLGWLLAWFGPACLMMGLRGLSPGKALRHTFLAVWLAHSLILHWFYVVTVTYGHAPAAVGVIAPIGAALYAASITCWFGFAWAWLQARGRASVFIAACLWVALEHLRGFALGGFPWASLGYSQHENGALLGIASLTGVYGLSFVVFLVGAALARFAQARQAGAPTPRQVWLALGVAILAHGLGPLVRPADASGGETLRVAALQGNIDQGVKWSRDWFDRTLQIYEDLSRQAAREGAQLIVWPESAVPGALELDPQVSARLSRLARETQTALVVGSMGIEFSSDQSGREGRRFFDSAFLVEPSGELGIRYDKSHLVPFGEYVPLRALLGEFIGGVATGIASSDVTPGEGPRAISLVIPGAEGQTSVRLGTVICYELLFPNLVRRFAADGAQILLGLTNDAWYGRTGAPYQFLAMTAMRSAETATWTVRAANTGVSAIIDSTGRVRSQTAIFERGMLVAEIPLRDLQQRPTLYVRIGDAFALACWGVSILAIALAGRRGANGIDAGTPPRQAG